MWIVVPLCVSFPAFNLERCQVIAQAAAARSALQWNGGVLECCDLSTGNEAASHDTVSALSPSGLDDLGGTFESCEENLGGHAGRLFWESRSLAAAQKTFQDKSAMRAAAAFSRFWSKGKEKLLEEKRTPRQVKKKRCSSRAWMSSSRSVLSTCCDPGTRLHSGVASS